MTNAEVDRLAQTLWNFNRIGAKPSKADVILVLGSTDTRVAKRAAQLFLQGYAPLLVFTGGAGEYTRTKFSKPEAEVFADVAI